ncbi:MAG: Zn-ribbon domain-containing OB-fold protein [Thermoplasmata archaeon]
MRVYECEACGRLTYPVHFLCHDCGSRKFEEVEVSEGTLLTYTVIHAPPPGVPSPLTLGIAEFEGGVRALGQLSEPMEIGAKVRAEWAVLRKMGDRQFEGFKFHRVQGQSDQA